MDGDKLKSKKIFFGWKGDNSKKTRRKSRSNILHPYYW